MEYFLIYSFTLVLIGISFLIYGLRSRSSQNQVLSPKKENSSPKTKSKSPLKNSKNSSPRFKINSDNQNKKQKEDFLAEVYIFFGSQSGTAAKYSNILAQDAENNNFSAKVVDLEEFESFKFNEKICFFCMATYGEGEPTDNAKLFYKFLKTNDEENNLNFKGLKFSVFGLGNTQYQHYNAMGRNVDKFLEKLGGERIYKYGEGDDNSSLEDDFNLWKENIWTEIKGKINFSQEKEEQIILHRQESLKHIEFEHKIIGLLCTETSEKEIDLKTYSYKNDSSIEYEFQTKQFLDSFEAQLDFIKEVRQNNADGSTLHLEINLTNTPIKYLTAQNLAIYPKNREELVQDLAEHLGFNLNKVIKLGYGEDGISKRKFKYPFPSPLKIRTILTNFCDFQGPIMKKTLKDLANFIPSKELKERFEYLASNEGKLDFKKEIEEQKLTLLHIIKQHAIKLSLEQFITLTPRINPRYFTISSSNLMFPNKVHVTASILEENLKNGGKKTGLVSQYFKFLQEEYEKGNKNSVIVNFKESNFVLPKIKSTPILMIGPGCGLAPFRGFLQEKEYFLENKIINPDEMEMTLYFGCKHENGDYIYKDEIDQFVKNKILQKYFCAFSRDQGEKIYVQNILKKNYDDLYDFIKNRNGVIYICGATQMGKDVIEVMENVWMEKELKTKEQAKEEIKSLESKKQLIKELWG